MMTCEGGKGCCGAHWLSWILVLIGGLNWGLVGLGRFMGSDWNVVHLILQSLPAWVESVVYVLVGLAAIVLIVGCRCKTCSPGSQM